MALTLANSERFIAHLGCKAVFAQFSYAVGIGSRNELLRQQPLPNNKSFMIFFQQTAKKTKCLVALFYPVTKLPL